jgi:hypothetical protein
MAARTLSFHVFLGRPLFLLSSNGIKNLPLQNFRLLNWPKCNQVHSYFTTQNTVWKFSFLLKKPIFNILSDIVTDVTSFDFVVFVVRRRLVLPNFGELQ